MTNDDRSVRLAELLESCNRQLVLAESCTGGRVAAELTCVPGISRYFCGSIVSYQDWFKIDWLTIPDELIRLHTSVSEPVTRGMAAQVLSQSRRANLAAAVTGHVGPLPDDPMDGLVFVAIAHTVSARREIEIVECCEYRLETLQRSQRQAEAAGLVLGQLIRFLEA
jgi:PncC family amidohydrolase